MMRTTEYVDWKQQWDGVPVVWGESDCTAWAARWVEFATGKKLDLPKWNSRRDAQRLIAEAGSLEALWDEHLAKVGIYQTSEARWGDVGIMNTTVAGPVGGIFSPWAAGFNWRAEDGIRLLSIRPANLIAIWSVGYNPD